MTYRSRKESIQKISELVGDISIGMLVTIGPYGRPRSRPMDTQEAPFDGTLWYVTPRDASAVSDLVRDHRVNVSFSAPDANSYLSLTGTARVLYDPDRAQTLWTPDMKRYFSGPDDPALRLIRVDVEEAEFWDAPGGNVELFFSLVKEAVTGEGGELGTQTGMVMF